MGAPRGIGLNTIFTERNEDFLDRQLILALDQRKKSRDYETVQVSEVAVRVMGTHQMPQEPM